MAKTFRKILDIKIIFVFNSLLLIYTFNLHPLHKYPSYDYFWTDTMTVSRLYDVKESIKQFVFPSYNFYNAFGLEKISELNYYQNPFNLLNLILITPISVEVFIVVKSIIFLSLLGYGTYELLSLVTSNKHLKIFFGLTITTVPVLWGQIFSSVHFYFICSVPFLIWLFEKFKLNNKLIYHLLSILLINMIGPDIISTLAIFLLYFSLLTSMVLVQRRFLTKSVSLFLTLTPIIGTMSFAFPFLNFFIESAHNTLPDRNSISLFDYFKFLTMNGAHSVIYPKESSAINLYVPISLYLVIFFSLFCSFKNKNRNNLKLNYFVVLAFAYILSPICIYLIEPIAQLFPSYLRFQFSLWSMFIWLIAAISVSTFKVSNFGILKILVISISFEIFWFLFNPFDNLKLLGFQSSIDLIKLQNILGTNQRDPDLENLSILNLPYFGLDFEPWLLLIIVNVIFLIVLKLVTQERVQIGKKLNSVIIALIFLLTFQMFATYSDLRKYGPLGNIPLADDYRITNYQKRIQDWVTKYRINDPNYRLLISGDRYDNYVADTARNLKTLPDLELNNLYGIKTPFQYREINSKISSDLYNKLLGTENGMSATGAFFPPITSTLILDNSLNWLSSSSIKYIISADAKIDSKDFKLIDSYYYSKQKISYDYTDYGTVYLYKYAKYKSVAYSGAGEVLDVSHLNVNTVLINASKISTNEILTSFEYNPKLRAEADGKIIPIYKTSDGFVKLIVPYKSNGIKIFYHNSIFIFTFYLTIFYFFVLIIHSYRLKIISSPKN